MPEMLTLTDETLDQYLFGDKPVVLLFTNDEGGLRGDFMTAFKKAVDENANVIFARIDPMQNPKAAERFNAGGKALLVGLYCGEEVVRRSRPWGTDLPSALDALRTALQTNPPAGIPTPAAAIVKDEKKVEQTPTTIVENKPVHVTDATFEAEVLDSELPVLVDFWAEWCGPCRMVAPILDKMAHEFAGKVRIAKVDVDANPGLSQAFQVRSIPTIMMFKQRTLVFNQPGALPEPAFRDLLTQLVALEIPPQPEEADTETETESEAAD
jgi:thioredoxin